MATAQKRIKSISYAKYGYIFIAPFFIVYLFFQFYPLINTFILSFFGNGKAADDFVGIQNFSFLFGDASRAAKAVRAEFWLSMKNTVILWFGNFIPQISLSLLLAVWFTDAKLKIKGKGFFKVVMYMPNIITAASIAALFLNLLGDDKYGAINSMLINWGVISKEEAICFIRDEAISRGSVMFIQTWMWFGNTMIMLMSGIMGINPSLFEAADIDGANSGQTFRHVTLPLLKPIMLYTLVTSMIGGFQMFDIPYLFKIGTIVRPSLKTVAVFIYGHFKAMPANYGYAGAASVLLFIITAALGSIVFFMYRDKDEIRKKKQLKKLKKQAKERAKGLGGLGV